MGGCGDALGLVVGVLRSVLGGACSESSWAFEFGVVHRLAVDRGSEKGLPGVIFGVAVFCTCRVH